MLCHHNPWSPDHCSSTDHLVTRPSSLLVADPRIPPPGRVRTWRIFTLHQSPHWTWRRSVTYVTVCTCICPTTPPPHYRNTASTIRVISYLIKLYISCAYINILITCVSVTSYYCTYTILLYIPYCYTQPP